MLEEGITFDGVVGTSIGAINGAMIVQGSFDTCFDMWHNISYDQVISLEGRDIEELEELNFSVDSFSGLRLRLKEIISNKGFDISPLKKLLSDNIDEEAIRNSNMDFGLVTVNLTDMKSLELFKEDIPEGQMKDYILASAYLPGFKAERLNGKYYLDGAFHDNLPFGMLEKKGYEEFVMIRTHGTGITKKTDHIKSKSLIISPSQDLGKTYDYTKELAIRNVKMGYFDTLKRLRNYKGTIYTIDCNWTEEDFFSFIVNLSDKKVDEIRKIFHIQGVPRKRALFEIVIPKIAEELKLKENYNYSDLIIGLLEKRAKLLEIDEFKVYDFDTFYNFILESPEIKREKELTTLEYIIERTELTTVFNMDKIVQKVIDIIFSKDEVLLLE